MKLYWIFGCVYSGLRYADQAIMGTSDLGPTWWVRSLDGLLALMFFVAVVAAFRAKTAWADPFAK